MDYYRTINAIKRHSGAISGVVGGQAGEFGGKLKNASGKAATTIDLHVSTCVCVCLCVGSEERHGVQAAMAILIIRLAMHIYFMPSR